MTDILPASRSAMQTPKPEGETAEANVSSASTTSTTATQRVSNSREESPFPEATKQPILETIAPKAPKTSRRSGEPQSPRSIENSLMEERSADSLKPSPPRTQHKTSSRSSSHTHQKTSSDEIPRTIYHGGYVAVQPPPPPQPATAGPVPYGFFPAGPSGPFTYYGPQMPPHMVMASAPMPGMMVQGGMPRTRTYSDEAHYALPDHMPRFYGPPPPSQEHRPLLSHANSERQMTRTQRRHGRHRKSNSYSHAIQDHAGYGALWSGHEVPPRPGSAQSSPSQGARKTFDPRNELMGLASRLSPNVSPQVTPVSTTRRVPDLRVAFSPLTPMHSDGHGGEAMYLAQKRHKAESTRRKHMRQHSAQLFMEETKGIPQSSACRDVFFLLLFVFHLLFIVSLGNLYSKEAFQKHTHAGSVTVQYDNLLALSVMSGAFAIVVSSILLGVMALFAEYFVQVALCVVITLSFVWGTIGIGLSPRNVVPITGIIALALSVAYTFIVWDRIPFAAANLMAAFSAIRDYPSTILLAIIFQVIALGWSIYFCVVVIGVYDVIHEGKLEISHQWEVFIYVLLGTSFYWTFQVLLNTVQAVTAAVVGSWWDNPYDVGVVQKATFRTIFYSMGSICFGSLFVGPVRFIRQVAVFFRPSSEEASLLCLHECLHCVQTCITTVVDSLANHFNTWSFTYIGLYNYGFLESGRRATDLFERRGWTVIVSDDLVPNVLLMTSLVLGGVTGLFAHLMERLDNFRTIVSLDEPGVVSFWLGMVNGLVMTSVLFGVISSSVNAVLVCFAVKPVDFDTHHPELSDDMRNAWREVWPGALDVDDFDVVMGGPSHMADGLTPLGPAAHLATYL